MPCDCACFFKILVQACRVVSSELPQQGEVGA